MAVEFAHLKFLGFFRSLISCFGLPFAFVVLFLFFQHRTLNRDQILTLKNQCYEEEESVIILVFNEIPEISTPNPLLLCILIGHFIGCTSLSLLPSELLEAFLRFLSIL